MQHFARLGQYQRVSRLTATHGRLKEPGKPGGGEREEKRAAGMPGGERQKKKRPFAEFTQNPAVTLTFFLCGLLQILS